MRCNGRFQPIDIIKKRGKRSKQRKKRVMAKPSAEVEETCFDKPGSFENDQTNPTSANNEDTSMNTSHESSDESSDQDSDSDDSSSGSVFVASKPSPNHLERGTKVLGAPCCNAASNFHTSCSGPINESAFNDQTEQDLEKQLDWNSMSKEMKIMVVRHRLNIFQIVYGEGKLECAKHKFDINYISPVTLAPKTVPKSGLRTQGHLRLQQVSIPEKSPALSNHLIQSSSYAGLDKAVINHGLNHNQSSLHKPDVYTEDPTFGLTMVPPKQRATAEDLTFYYAQFKRIKERDGEELYHFDDSLAGRTEAAESNEEERQNVIAQLEQKFFNWETPDSMKGLWVRDIEKSDGNPETTFQNKFYYFGENPVYLEIKQRQRILAEGGERAMKLIEEELAIERQEIVRARRRAETARSRAKRQVEEFEGQHAKKRVRWSRRSVDE